MVIRKHFEVGETAVNIIAEERFIGLAESAIFESREEILRYASRDPFFLLTIEPYDPLPSAPFIIKRMCTAAKLAGVGPMAAVAGAIAESAVEKMVDAGADHAIVDNGGDIAMKLSRRTDIGIYTGDDLVEKIGFRCEPREGIFGICTSSGNIGHSISFGISDAAVVISKNVTLADACATLLGNLVTSDDENLIKNAIERVCSIDGVEGALVIVNGKVAMKGTIPKLIRSEFSKDSISKITFPSQSRQ